jgi:UDP-N-acetylmuramoylalanine--D-glutamate ligase
VLNAGDARLVEWAKTLESKTNVLWFGSGPIPSNGVWYENGALFSRVDGKTDCLLDVNEMKLRGVHNYENAAAAATAALLAGTSREAVAQGLLAFPGLEHRLEFVAEINTVRYYNDSKSTTAESVACAVAAFEHNVHLIAGGRDKGCDFSVVDAAIARHVKTIVLIGEAANRMETQWKGKAPIVRAKTLEEAVESAFARAVGGDVVVFSPGCSSFDMFKNFEHRGEVFKQLVRQLTKERELRDE